MHCFKGKKQKCLTQFFKVAVTDFNFYQRHMVQLFEILDQLKLDEIDDDSTLEETTQMSTHSGDEKKYNWEERKRLFN